MKKWNKLWIILSSRFKKPSEESWVIERINKCLNCEHHSSNTKNKTLKVKIITILSSLYNLLFGKLTKKWGFCSICGCDTLFMTAQPETECSDYGNEKWKSIYIPNKK